MNKPIGFAWVLVMIAIASCSDSGGTTACKGASTDCNGTCVALASDTLNCGACGHACVQGQVCSAGFCMLSCQPGFVNQNGTCVEAMSVCGADAAACPEYDAGTPCGATGGLDGGICEPACPPGLLRCDGLCVNPGTDRAHCGASGTCTGQGAGRSCAAGEVCSAGTCGLSCQLGLVKCGDQCVDPANDPQFCGADPSCAGGVACGAGAACVAGACRALCPAGRLLCGDGCVDPNTDPSYCGASGSCAGASAGAACQAGQSCVAGSCACPRGTLRCGTACVDPLLDAQHCGASADCAGANAGSACGAEQVCIAGACAARPDIDWRPSNSLAPPSFKAGSTTVAHVVFDGSSMVDSTGHTHWTAVGAPGSRTTGMWAPAQPYSGPFSSTVFWQADAASKAWLDMQTSGDFLVCARFKPGRHPGLNSDYKIIVANGIPHGPAGGGWSLMQMHEAMCFHYHDATETGEWMAPVITREFDRETLYALEWTWQCGGRNGAGIRGAWESYEGGMMGVGGQPDGTPLGAARATPGSDLPTIGAYSDGSRPLYDGGVYEVIIKAEPATLRNMWKTIAQASGGLRVGNTAPVQLLGADRAFHTAPPSTVWTLPNGAMPAGQRVWMADVLRADPTASGECFGIVASSQDWSSILFPTVPLSWSLGDASSRMRWDHPITSQCVSASHPAYGGSSACGAPPALNNGSRYTFVGCFNQADRRIHVYQDGVEFAVNSAALPPGMFPRLDDPASSFITDYEANAEALEIHRVFACSTSDPAACR